VTELSVANGRRGREVQFVATDVGGRVAVAEIAVDDGDWRVVVPDDGVADSPRESYTVRVESPAGDAPGSVRVRVVDAAGNVGGDLAASP
jgi:hypothetical protein